MQSIDGFMLYGGDVLELPQLYQDLIDFFAQTPSGKLRAMQSSGTPVEILNGVLAGVDLFESNYPLQQAQYGLALQIEHVKISEEDTDASKVSRLLDGRSQKTLDLTKEECKSSKLPMTEGCSCYTCKNYTRAYIYHMLEVKEMNATILLAIHNVH